MTATLRPATEADYGALAELNNLVYPHEVLSREELLYHDASARPPCKLLRLVATEGGDLRGSGSYAQYPGSYHPRHFHLDIQVHPDHRRRGIGGALYRELLARLAPFDPERLQTYVRVDDGVLDHVLRLGYVERKREWQTHLDPSTLDLKPFEGLARALADQGIHIGPYSSLPPREERDRRFYELYREVRLDVPRSSPATDWSYEYFRLHNLDSPNFYPEGTFLARADGSYVGLSQLWRSSVGNDLYVGLTAVRRGWRRRGIALALKVEAIRFAAGVGAPNIYTDNATDNTGMIAINDRLGFTREVAWADLHLDLGENA